MSRFEGEKMLVGALCLLVTVAIMVSLSTSKTKENNEILKTATELAGSVKATAEDNNAQLVELRERITVIEERLPEKKAEPPEAGGEE